MKKIAVFYKGKKNYRIEALEEAARKLGVMLDSINYKEVRWEADKGKGRIKLGNGAKMEDYGVLYFRTVKSSWEEANMVIDYRCEGSVVVDKVLERGRPTDFCKISQMRRLTESGLRVPKLMTGSLKYLRTKAIKNFEYPVILKGSQGDRRTQVFKFFSDLSWEKGWEKFCWREVNEGQRYMLQEYIETTEDYRVMVVGGKVLGVMKRAIGDNPRLKNVFSKSTLEDWVLKKAVEAAQACEIDVAGVDVAFKKGESEPYFWEVNKSPNYDQFMKSTGIDVPEEIVKYLALRLK